METRKKSLLLSFGILTALTLTIALFLLFAKTAEGEIDITMEVEGAKDGYVEIYYTSAQSQAFNSNQRKLVRVSTEREKVSFHIDVPLLCRLRLDYESPMREVTFSNVIIKGKHEKKLSFNDIETHQLSVATSIEDHIVLRAEGSDPHIVFSQKLNIIPYGRSLDSQQWLLLVIAFCLFSILAFFVVSGFIASRLVFNDFVFLCLSFVIVIIPNLHISKEEKSITENRMFAKKPAFVTDREINSSYGTEFESWFNDHFFLRDNLLELYNRCLWHMNRMGKVKDVVVGDDGWLFRAMDSYCYQNTRHYSDNQLMKIATYIRDVSQWCQNNDVEFRFMIAPDKERVYGDRQHIYRKVRPDSENWTLQLINYIEEHTDVEVIYPLDRLRQERESGALLYYKYDTHWSELGSYYGYKALMQTLPEEWQLEILSLDELDQMPHPYGDISAKLANVIPADTSHYLYHRPGTQVKKQGAFFVGGNLSYDNPEGQKKVYFLHDSFSKNMLDYWLSDTFAHIAADWHYQVTPAILDEIVGNHYDMLVLEVVERFSCLLAGCSFPKN